MKTQVIRFALLILVLAATGCEKHDDENEQEIQSFSSYVRDVFEESENDEPESVVEGVDFQFEDADESESFSDLLDNKS